MSNFYCEKCHAAICEDFNGTYITFCPHYPRENDFEEELRANAKKPFDKPSLTIFRRFLRWWESLKGKLNDWVGI